MKIRSFDEWYHYKFGEDHVFEGHTHETLYEINIVLDGSMEIVAGDRIIEAQRGRIVVVSPSVFHRNRAIGDGAEMLVLQFSAEDCNLNGLGAFTRDLDELEISLARLLLRELETRVRYSMITDIADADLKICTELLDALFEITLSGRGDTVDLPTENARIYGEVVRYMEKHICEKLLIADVARAVCVSPSTLKKLFSEIAGQGVIEYFNEMKIRRARRMLESGDSVLYVSSYLGFSSQCYFTSVFKRMTGETPARVRRKC